MGRNGKSRKNLALRACVPLSYIPLTVSRLTDKGIDGSQTQDSEPIAYSCVSKRTGQASIGVPMGYPPCYVAHAVVWRRLSCFLGHCCKHMTAQSLLQTRVLCCASLQAKGRSSKKLRHRHSGDLTCPGGELLLLASPTCSLHEGIESSMIDGIVVGSPKEIE